MSKDVGFDVELRSCPTSVRWSNSCASDYGGLHVVEIQRLRVALAIFGQHFASMDVRQDSRVLRRAAEAMGIEGDDVAVPDGDSALARMLLDVADDVERDAVEVMAAIREIQFSNGVRGLPPVHHQQLSGSLRCSATVCLGPDHF